MTRSLAVAAAIVLVLVAAPHWGRAQESKVGGPLVANGGFEADLDHWSVHVYGAPARFEVDKTAPHEGTRALRISADELSDAALGQNVVVRPSQWYRFTGWVRTHALNPHDAPIYGTYQIQLPDRHALISGENHRGDTEWTRVSLVFLAPADGKIRIAPFFVGYGKGTGTAWFDDLLLEEVDFSSAPVQVTSVPLSQAEISPYQYGQFIEYLCNLVPSMWAEKLYDGSFEGLSPYRVAYLKESDFREQPWVPSGSTNRAEYVLESNAAVSGKTSQRIAVQGSTPCTVGVSQNGISAIEGRALLASIYLKQKDVAAPVTLSLHHKGKVYATTTFEAAGEWKKFTARLVPSGTDHNATLSITFRGPGTLWLDNASLMPEDNIGGWRPDVVDAVRALKPGVIRFGGTALEVAEFGDFEWRDTIGNPDRRKPFRAWGGLQPTGPGLEEIVQFCRQVGAEPLICVRVTGRMPKDAADEVEYFNGAADTPMGKLRAANGHAEPYRIKFWQIGNELAGPDYESRLRGFCTAMKAVDPTIRLLSSYPSEGVVKQAGDLLDYVCPHHYDAMNLAGAEQNFREIRSTLSAFAKGRNLKVAVTEWNTTAGDWGPRRARLWSLENGLAVSRYHNLLHRQCDLVEIANRSNLTNSFCSGIIQTDNHRLYKTPAYYAQQLYATLAGNQALKIDSDVPVNAGPDFSATRSTVGGRVTLFATNASLSDITRPLDLSAFGNGARDIDVWTLADREHADEPDVANSFADPERVVPVRSKFHAGAGRFEYKFPRLSLTVMQWNGAKEH